MARYCVTFETPEYIEMEDAYWAIGLDPETVFSFYEESPKKIIENNNDLNQILKSRKLSDVLGKSYCMKIINKDEDLQEDCDAYGWREVVDDVDRDNFLWYVYDSEDEEVIDDFFERLGYFTMTAGYSGWSTFVIPLELKKREHLKEDVGNIYDGYGCYEASVWELNDKNVKDDCEVTSFYYSRKLSLGDDDVDNVLDMAGIDPGANKIYVESNDNTNDGYSSFKKYKLVDFEADSYLMKEV